MIRTPTALPRRPVPEAPTRPLVLHLPESKRPGGLDLSLTGGALLLAGLAFYLAAQLPAPKAPVEETLEMVEEAPLLKPPEEIEEPPKPPEPPAERTPPSATPVEAPPPVFGLQEDEASEAGDMTAATGNTLAVKADSVVQPPPPPLATAPVELDRPPGFLRQVMAEYPEWAQDQGVEAKVLVWVTIDAEGQVTESAVKRGAGKDFDAEALKAARMSLFQPLVRNGAKMPSRFVVTYDFKLE
jgi:TonB family protein